MTKIKIRVGEQVFPASLFDTPTAQAILDTLPFESTANTWGDEIYFQVPAYVRLESDARSRVAVGDLAYWPTMPAFCIFFGPTPASFGDEPRAASDVNVFGRLDDVDLSTLRNVRSGQVITVELKG